MGSVGVQRRFWKPRLRAFFLTSTKLTENAEATLRPYLPRAHGKLPMLSTLYNVGTAEFMINCCFPHLCLASLPLPSPSSCYNLSRPFAFPEKKACFGFEGLAARAGDGVVTKALCVPS